MNNIQMQERRKNNGKRELEKKTLVNEVFLQNEDLFIKMTQRIYLYKPKNLHLSECMLK